MCRSRLIILLICLLYFASLGGITQNINVVGGVQGHESIIFSDDFESYPIGSFPSRGGWEIVWDGAGREYQKVIVAKELLGFDEGHGRVLHLLGVTGWSSVVKRSFTTNSRYIGYEFDVLILNRGEGYRDHPGFFCEECRTWGAYWATVEFSHKDGKIYARDGTILGSWTPGRWYHVKVILDRENDRYDVYIDGQLKGHDLLARGSDDPSSWNIKSLALVSGWPGKPVLYDNVKVFIVEAGSTTTTTTGAMGDLWTDKGGRGYNVDDGSYRLFEAIVFYFKFDVRVLGPCLRFIGPYGEASPLCMTLAPEPGKTHNIPIYFNEERDIGEWTIILEATLEESNEVVEVDRLRIWITGETTTTTATTTELGVKFRGIVWNEPSEPYDVIVKIDEVLLDPEGRLSLGDMAHLDIAVDPENLPAPNIDWPLHKGDRVEIYARHYQYNCWNGQHDICVWIYLMEYPYDGYVKKLEELKVDIYTDRGGRGSSVPDGEYVVGETIRIYCSVNTAVDRLRVRIVKPDGSQLTIYDASWSGGIFQEAGTAGYPLGERRAICEAWKGDSYARDETRYQVKEAITTTITITSTITETKYAEKTTYTTVHVWTTITKTKWVESDAYTTTTVTRSTTTWVTVTTTTTITSTSSYTSSAAIAFTAIPATAAFLKARKRWRKK